MYGTYFLFGITKKIIDLIILCTVPYDGEKKGMVLNISLFRIVAGIALAWCMDKWLRSLVPFGPAVIVTPDQRPQFSEIDPSIRHLCANRECDNKSS